MIKTVLITGGLGYLGGRIAQALVRETDYRVLIGTHGPNLPPPAWLPQVEIVSMDYTSGASLDEACKGVNFIVHLAALNEIDSAAHPDQALLVNTLATLRLLQRAEQHGVQRFLYFSTAHIYGSPLAGTITERTLPRPVHPYAITHKAAEDFIIAAHDLHILNGIIVRLSNGFGAPAHAGVNRWSLVANDLCREAVLRRTLTLKSSGLQNRDFVTLHDVSRAVAHFLTLPLQQCGDGVFNLGGENPLRIIDLAERIADRCQIVLGFRPALHRPPPRSGEESNELDYRIDKLKSTGFSLCSDIDQEIDDTLHLCQREIADKP